jgi:hypothetical protein
MMKDPETELAAPVKRGAVAVVVTLPVVAAAPLGRPVVPTLGVEVGVKVMVE